MKKLIFFTSILLVVIWFRSGNLMGTGESGLPFYNISLEANITRHSWTDVFLGFPTTASVGTYPLYKVFTVIEQTFSLKGYQTEALFIFIVLIISGFSIDLLVCYIFPNTKLINRYTGVLFYWFNPFAAVNIWNRFLYNYMLFYAILPLLLYVYYKGINERRIEYAFGIGILVFIFSYAIINVPFILLMLGLFLLTTIYFSNKRTILFNIKFYAIAVTSIIAINFWWIAQLFIYTHSSDFKVSVSSFFTIEGNVSNLLVLSKLLGNLSYIFRLKHGTFYNSTLLWTSISNFVISNVLEFVTIGSVLWIAFKNIKVKTVRYFVLLFIIALFLIKGSELPFGEIFLFLFKRVSFLQVFRNPYEKFGFLLPIAITPIFVFSLSKLSKFIRIVIYFTVFLLWGFSFWSGLVFTAEKTNEIGTRSYTVTPPNEYSDANNFFKKQGDYRFISLPIKDEGITYNWGYSGVELSGILFSNANISFNTTIPFYNTYVTKLVNMQNSDKFLDYLPYLGIKYILLRTDIDYKASSMANPQTIQERLSQWESEGLVKLVFSEGVLKIYELSDEYVWPKIYSTTNVIQSDSFPSELSASVYDLTKHKNVIINTQDKSITTSNLTLVEPVNTYIYKTATTPIDKLSNEDILSKLFTAKYLPNQLQYYFARVKEFFTENSNQDYEGKLLYKTGVLGKRAAEIYKAYKEKKGQWVQNVLLSEYKKEFYALDVLFFDISNSNSPAGEVVRNSLAYQYTLLKRTNKDIVVDLEDSLIKYGILAEHTLPGTEHYVIYIFKINKEGNYKINNDTSEVYIDGNYTKTKNGMLFLTSGRHEIAVKIIDDKIYNKLIALDNLSLGNNDIFTKTFTLPDTSIDIALHFDFKFDFGDRFQLSMVQDIDTSKNPLLGTLVLKDNNWHTWRSWDTKSRTIPGAKSIQIKISPYIQQCTQILKFLCTNTDSGKYQVELRNLSITQKTLPTLSLSLQSGTPVDDTQDITIWNKTSPVNYEVSINTHTLNNYLVFSELYDSGWKAYYEDTGQELSMHYLSNGYSNTWSLNRIGEYKVIIKYLPETDLQNGIRISFIALVSVLIVELFILIRNKKYENQIN